MAGLVSFRGRITQVGSGRWQPPLALYPSILIVSMILGRWLQYVTEGDPWLRGQPAAVVVQAGAFLLALVVWTLTEPSRRSSRTSTWLLASFGFAWVIHIVLAMTRGDAYMHLVWLMIPILVMLWWKPLSAQDWQSVMWVAGLAIAVSIAVTIVLELLGVLDRPYLNPGLITFEENNYWLPLSTTFGVEGRWQGPYGHSGDTGAVAALLLIIGLAVWRKTSVFVVAVAALALVLTSVRAAYIAAAVGAAIVVVFGQSRWVSQIRVRTRLVLSATAVGLIGIVLVGQSINLTGRSSSIWPAFWDLWLTSPVVGVGSVGIANSGGLTALSVHAHNFLLDELTRNGLLGFIVQFFAVGFALVLAFRAMLAGSPGPFAILAAYVTIGISQVMNDWLHPSLPVMLVIASGLWADASTPKSPSRTETSSSST